MRKLYSGIDLHSNNIRLAIVDQNGKADIDIGLRNDLDKILRYLRPYKNDIQGIVVESTFNWYWLVDGLMENGYKLHLANPAAFQQYKGLKHTDDKHDALWLANMLRLGILPEGYIYPKEQRGVRDLSRKRGRLINQRTMNVLSLQSLINRLTGYTIDGASIKRLRPEELKDIFTDPNYALCAQSNLSVIEALEPIIKKVEGKVLEQVKLKPEYKKLLTIDGVGPILALTIMLETGDIGRFKKVGDFASYCRLVPSQKLSNQKRKGKGNVKNGNKYLCWAFIEAANHLIWNNERAEKYYRKKLTKTKRVIALKTIAHKLSRASYYMLRDQKDFDEKKIFV